jgi:hypothetical protein
MPRRTKEPRESEELQYPADVARMLEAVSVKPPKRIRLRNTAGKMKYAREYVVPVPGKGPVSVCLWLDGSGWFIWGNLLDAVEAIDAARAAYQARKKRDV